MMQAPIPIAQAPSRLDAFSFQRPGGLTPRASSSFVGSASYKEPMAVSFGKDVSEIMDYSISRFGTSTESDATVAPSSVRLESTFCRNFTCCGQKLDDLHDLLQHYEECHVRFEDDEMPAMIADDEVESSGSSNASTSQPSSPRTSNAGSTASAAAAVTAATTPGASTSALDVTTPTGLDDVDKASAFDTAIMRSPSLSKGKKRSFGQYSSSSSANPNGAIHNSLRRALIDGGVGRRAPGTPNIYAPNSPFSTPGGSIPGTPSLDAENDGYFTNGLNPAAFSALSIRSSNTDDHHLPSCAPPNLFFPASGTASSSSQPPAKREKTSAVTTASTIALENALRAGAANVDKPYKCPAPGCDKAYKQMNGLKYHRLHGHCNQNNLPITAQAAAQPPTIHISTNSTASSPQPESADGLKVEDGVTTPTLGSPSSPTASANSSPDPASPATQAPIPLGDRLYICQVGACGKRYKNLNGLRYHYLHSGSHGLLGLQLLQSGGGASAKVDATGRAPVSTSTLSQEEIAAAAQAAQLAQEQIQAQAAKSAAATAAAAAAASAAAAARKEEIERQTPTISTPPSGLTQALQAAAAQQQQQASTPSTTGL
ncbi:Zinc finger C2H2-type/integrase DNA-binding domain protein [Kalmanozyma brasiliensis GHG001]|uniref:Putative transcriptional repressor regulating G2/M transition n=1 Tax=Kalmanozyma brasiliensis (strain GHG001) TaxID=1365824 RepID=V5EZZ6_KALBG|nr:Zinc finger C2H2-type/integrase DNA-binding domain protein [Kalmanozyma brasiliensis GHG001]EST09553.1 Zinc finger C2H2-type/integrase DNA-binding domain protein [Kalmanozyma brasiliensis GHG001]